MIRAANEKDAHDICTIGIKSFRKTFGHLFRTDVINRYLAETYNTQKIERSIRDTENVYFVYEMNNTVIGFIKYKLNSTHSRILNSTQIQLQKLYVDPLATEKGVGGQLLRRTITEMGIASETSVWLMVYEGNDLAKSFYQKHGFTIIAEDTHDFENIRINFNVMGLNMLFKANATNI